MPVCLVPASSRAPVKRRPIGPTKDLPATSSSLPDISSTSINLGLIETLAEQPPRVHLPHVAMRRVISYPFSVVVGHEFACVPIPLRARWNS